MLEKRFFFFSKLFIGVVFLLCSSALFSQTNQQWFQYYSETKLNERFSLLADGGFRWRQQFSKPSQYIARAGVGYELNQSARVAIGFAQLGFFQNEKVNRLEYRPYQEFLFSKKLNKLGLSSRIRIEQRFFQDRISSAQLFWQRYRISISGSYPLYQFKKESSLHSVVLILGNELFLKSFDQNDARGFSQNRLFVSPSLRVSESLMISVTYNHQTYLSQNAASLLSDSVFWLQLKQNFGEL